MKQGFFQGNRNRVSETLSGVFILSAYHSMQRSNDAVAMFEQEANFWWLTGIEEPGWTVILDTNKQESWLVQPEVSEVHQVFEGSLSLEAARKVSGIDEVISQKSAQSLLFDLSKEYDVAYALDDHPHTAHFDFVVNPAQKEVWNDLGATFKEVKDCRSEFAKLRAIKQPEEIQAIRDAIHLTIEGFETVKKNFKQYKFEYEIEAEFSYRFRNTGAIGHAYSPIIAGGKNACTLHYIKNQSGLVSGELVLLDVGARVNGYPADISRTYAYGPVSERHKAVHSEVEAAHRKIIALLAPGVDVKEYFQEVDKIMQSALQNLGLMKDEGSYRKYFPHSISHGLGIDVHDSLGGPKTLLAGMVLTVEPGIYIPEEGIGVRIEDDILITETGYENLSAGLATVL